MVNAMLAVVVYGVTVVRVSLTTNRAKRFRLWCECDRKLSRWVK